MVSIGTTKRSGAARLSHWLGRSGHDYALTGENVDSFSMNEADLYLIAQGGNALWVGSTEDLVADPVSRVRFRLALDCATGVFRMPAPQDRHSVIWDLEGAAPLAFAAQAA